MFNTYAKEVGLLKEENQNLLSTIQKQNIEISDYRQTIAGFIDVKDTLESNRNKVESGLKSEISGLKLKLEIEKKSVNARVNKALSDIGVTSFAMEEITTPGDNSPQSIYDKFMSMEGANKSKYFKEHEQVLTKLVGFNKI